MRSDSHPASASVLPSFGAALPEAVSPAHQEILRQEQTRLFGQAMNARVIALPVFAGLLVGLAALQPWGWKAAVLVTLAVVAPALFVIELIRYRKQGMTPRAVPLNLAAATVGQLLVTACTGGLTSPVIYAVVPIGILLGTFLARPVSLALLGMQVSAVWGFAFAADHRWLGDVAVFAFDGQPATHATAAYYYTHAAFVSVVLLAASQFGRFVSCTHQAALRRALLAQQESLDAHSERVDELTSLTAEIAHELKNPLASVKGLSSLLAQNIQDKKGSERLDVLRQEVARMQRVLEEFLTFSRPLVPLALVPSSVSQLAFDVAALHEGLAREQGVKITVRGEHHSIECDPRKVKQILINLLQNAIEASPRGSSIVLQLEPEGEATARVRVMDRGAGVAAELGDVFAPGTTSKAQGAGIGLTIARALARQHGGELTLEPREGGGTVAELTLPTRR